MAPMCCLSSTSQKNKKKNYKLLKNYIIDRLCIKYILVKANEVEKLKVFALTEEQRKDFDDKKTPIPSAMTAKLNMSIWDELMKNKKISNKSEN